MTKLDVLDGLPELQVCTAYRCNGATLTEMPGDHAQLAACEPIYETLPGWSAPTQGVKTYDQLPREARAYVARLEEITGVPAAIVSTGSGRDETILREGVLSRPLWRSADAAGRRQSLCLEQYLVHRCRVGIVELDAGAIARRFRRFRQLELRPRHRAAESHHEVLGRDADADALIRPQDSSPR